MGRSGILLILLALTGCGVKGYHVVHTSPEPLRIYYLDEDANRVYCPKSYSTFSNGEYRTYYRKCQVYLEYPVERENVSIPRH